MHTSAGASPAAAGDASNPGGWTGTSRDVASLREWLDANGVDANAFGVNGAKSLADLAIEVERGETTLAKSKEEIALEFDAIMFRKHGGAHRARPSLP